MSKETSGIEKIISGNSIRNSNSNLRCEGRDGGRDLGILLVATAGPQASPEHQAMYWSRLILRNANQVTVHSRTPRT